MDTKTQNPPVTHTQPHSNSRPPNHTHNQCHCGHCCQGCSQSPTGHQSQRSRPGPPPRQRKRTMRSRRGPTRRTAHSCGCTKNRKNLGGRVNKRKVVKRSRQAYKAKRRSSGWKHS